MGVGSIQLKKGEDSPSGRGRENYTKEGTALWKERSHIAGTMVENLFKQEKER